MRTLRAVGPLAWVAALVAACSSSSGDAPGASPRCGDGALAPGETCDDGGTLPGDGCSAACLVEDGWACRGAPSTCVVAELRNDVFASGSSPAFVAGFVQGEAAAVTLGPVPAGFSVAKVRLLFGGSTATQTVTVRVYEEAGVAAPGAQLFAGDFTLTGSDSAVQELAIDPPIAGGRTVRVAMFWHHDGLPGVARDEGTTVASRNWVYASDQWLGWSALGTGNFVVRAVVQ